MKKAYYEAYEERYRTVHEKGLRWTSPEPTPVVMDVIRRYGIGKDAPILEIGCGEGRDTVYLLKEGYRLKATDISKEVIDYCRRQYPEYAEAFYVQDILKEDADGQYDLVIAVAVVHMLTEDADRKAFWQFIRNHLSVSGKALVCSMGDGEHAVRSDPTQAFELKEREHASGKILVPATTCRMVTWQEFEEEIAESGLKITEKGMTASPPEFDSLMYAVVSL
ncbi:MAG: methyltransferase domain-containing protein [Solobacterium sp.]|nr:methyltransferase domain-containing protein [Solobacterium sp.]